MAKLYATLENSKGKTVSISDNEQITATVYDGNMKAYSVIIEWTTVGDPEHLHCKKCGWQGDETEADGEECNICPECGIQKYITIETIPAQMGAIITTREWRNEPEERRKKVKVTDEKSDCICIDGQLDRHCTAKIHNW